MHFYQPIASYQDVLVYRFAEESFERLSLLKEGEKGWSKFMQDRTPLNIEVVDYGAWFTNYFGDVPDWLFHRRGKSQNLYKNIEIQLHRMHLFSEKIKNVLEEYWLPPAHVFIPVNASIRIEPLANRASEKNRLPQVIEKRYYLLYMPAIEQFEDIDFTSVAICFKKAVSSWNVIHWNTIKSFEKGEITSHQNLIREYEKVKEHHSHLEIGISTNAVYKKRFDLIFTNIMLVCKELREALFQAELKGVVFRKQKNREVIMPSDN